MSVKIDGSNAKVICITKLKGGKTQPLLESQGVLYIPKPPH